MNIALLSRNPKLYSTERLKQAAEFRGHHVEIIDVMRCTMSMDSMDCSIDYQGQRLPSFDVVIPRISVSKTFYGTAVVRHFEMMNVFCLNSSLAIDRSRNKLRALQLLAKKKVGLPKTGFAHSLEDVKSLIEHVGGAPLIIKLLEGSQGIGVVFADSKQAAESVIEAFFGLNHHIMVQEYIKESNGADIRCFVIGNEVVAAIERKAQLGEFRSNLHRGGKANPIELSSVEKDTALLATKIMGLNVAGVDILRSDRGPLVMEVNSSPGLEGIEKATHMDLAEKMIQFIEANFDQKDQRSLQS